MSGTSVIGLQWGDEAKGKLVDLLTDQHDIVVRYQGGANAGHTVVRDGQTYKLSLLPSGILTARIKCVVTGGVVLHPQVALKEINQLKERNIPVLDNLLLSDRAHVIFPWHLEEDRRVETRSSVDGTAIGTTQRGIGPCYKDKVARSTAIRLGDLYRPDIRQKICRIAAEKNRLLQAMDVTCEFEPLDPDAIHEEYQGYAKHLAPLVTDTTTYLLDALESGKRVLFEGAQGALLDVDHGTFPYVTSSNSSGVGVSSGTGVPAKHLKTVYGVVKAYSTRVGGGPFPTEQDNPTGQHIRDKGKEYGTVTGRPRRCGWFDAVAARYTARLSGVDQLTVMLLDVLSELDEIGICTAYEINGQRTNTFPSHVDDLAAAKPVYEWLPGWKTEISHLKSYRELPQQALAYVDRLSQLVGPPVRMVSVGPDRAQTLWND